MFSFSSRQDITRTFTHFALSCSGDHFSIPVEIARGCIWRLDVARRLQSISPSAVLFGTTRTRNKTVWFYYSVLFLQTYPQKFTGHTRRPTSSLFEIHLVTWPSSDCTWRSVLSLPNFHSAVLNGPFWYFSWDDYWSKINSSRMRKSRSGKEQEKANWRH